MSIYSHLFLKTIKNNEYSNEILSQAFTNFEDNIISNEDFSGLFDDVRLDDSRLGSTQAEKNKKISDIISELESIESVEGELNSDILGVAYEYLISQFASDSGKKAGEFYTPQYVAKLLAKIVTLNKKKLKIFMTQLVDQDHYC